MKYFFIVILLTNAFFAQPRRENFPPAIEKFQYFHSQEISFPVINGGWNVYYTYKIPYQKLIFEKDDGGFTAKFRVLVEILDSTGVLVDRKFNENKVSVNDFNLTNEKNLFLEDVIKFKINDDQYKVKTTLTDANLQNERRFDPKELNLSKGKIILKPFVIMDEKDLCEGKNGLNVVNYGGSIPFSEQKYDLAIAITDTSINSLDVEIRLDNTFPGMPEKPVVPEQHFNFTLDKGSVYSPDIFKCENILVLADNQNNQPVKLFIKKNINAALHEGKYKIIIRNNDNDNDMKEDYDLDVRWFDKPFSLMNPEQAISYLNYIESDSVIDAMLDKDESEYPGELTEYWKVYDPTPETTYNQLMFEYYNRIDYAMKEFRGIGKLNGAKTDRGMIYIRFGKPFDIERSSNRQGQVVETWQYLKPERKFIFVDKKGTGNFTLVEG